MKRSAFVLYGTERIRCDKSIVLSSTESKSTIIYRRAMARCLGEHRQLRLQAARNTAECFSWVRHVFWNSRFFIIDLLSMMRRYLEVSINLEVHVSINFFLHRWVQFYPQFGTIECNNVWVAGMFLWRALRWNGNVGRVNLPRRFSFQLGFRDLR